MEESESEGIIGLPQPLQRRGIEKSKIFKNKILDFFFTPLICRGLDRGLFIRRDWGRLPLLFQSYSNEKIR